MTFRFKHAITPILALLVASACQGDGPTSALVLAKDGVATKEAAPTTTWTGPQAGVLPPFKENAFKYRKPLENSDGGRFLKLPYNELVDINQRDEVPVRKVRSFYIQPLPKGVEKELEYESGGTVHKYRAMGALDGGSKLTMIYVHGRGGNRDWGFDDERFGGNFNRLKNMMLKAGGAYIAPDFTDFEAKGLAEIKALVAKYRPLTTGKLVVSCGSLGNAHCWALANDPQATKQIDGFIVLAGFPDSKFLTSPVLKSARKVPLVIAHGSWDPDFDFQPMVDFYQQVRTKAPGYPVRFLLFDTGRHGAPVRMIDWRDTLNWIASL